MDRRFPGSLNFYGPILGCAGAVEGGWNWARYCNKALDAQAAAADSMVKPDQQDARIEAWRKIFITAMDDAPGCRYSTKRYTVHSARMGARTRCMSIQCMYQSTTTISD
nr:hypothetical protein [Klebsiella pneumoniae subsp. pneumoniae]